MAKAAWKWRNYAKPDFFGKQLGYRLVRIDEKKHSAEARLKIDRRHLSPAGRVHGGVVSALFDFTCGAAVFSTLGPNDFCSTVELKVNYFFPLEVGDEVKASVQAVFRGKRLCVVHGFLTRQGEKKRVAMVTATFNVVAVS